MQSPFSLVRRVIVAVFDGLRPDAIERFDLIHCKRLMRLGAATCRGRTVDPSVTVAAMASILTGVSPTRHGLQGDRIWIPKTASGMTPLPFALAEAGYPSSAFLCDVPALFRGVVSRVAQRAGLGTVRATGKTAPETLLAARGTLRTQRRGLIFFHWPDADRAGHKSGWMSDDYANGARAVDDTLGMLMSLTGVPEDPYTLLILLADHGGGGVKACDHESDHPLDVTIPIAMVGGAVIRADLGEAHLLDVPATVLAALGVRRPPSYEGRALGRFDAEAPLPMAVA